MNLYDAFPAFEQGGCFEETNPRLLPGQAGKWAAWMKGEDGKPNNSPAACKKFCEGFRYYGVQARNQCFCGNNLHGDLKMMPESQCKDACPGDASQKCGAGGRMNLYQAPPGSIKKEQKDKTEQGCRGRRCRGRRGRRGRGGRRG